MKLYLTKPDLIYFDQFNEMMKEWCESGTQIAPWFLDRPFADIGLTLLILYRYKDNNGNMC